MRTGCIGLVLAAALAQAQPVRLPTDETWAVRSGLDAADIAAIRRLAGTLDRPGLTIQALDTISLRERNQVLLIESGNGHCTKPHVLTKTPETGWREVWTTPDPCGLCAQAPVSPTVRVVDGRIEIQVPIMKDPFIRVIPRETQVWTWNGTTYVPSIAPN
jgi:hypothetical protein